MTRMHSCPDCGMWHAQPSPPRLCARCGHDWAVHNDDGGRLKKAYCTRWLPPTDGRHGMAQCPCPDYRESDT